MYINVTPEVVYIYEKNIWVGSDKGPFNFKYKNVIIECGTSLAWSLINEVPGVKYGDEIKYAVNHFKNVYDLSNEIIDKDLAGVSETTGSEVFAIADLMELVPGGGFAWSAGWCVGKFFATAYEAGILDDFRYLGLYIDWKLHNWYCTNKPIIESSFPLDSTIKPSLSPTPNIENGYIVMRFTLPWSRDSYRSHNVNVYLNDIKIGDINNTIPEGHYTFRFDPSILNYADSGFASNKITVATDNLNGGHYIVATDIQVILPMKKVYIYVVASNQNEANEIIKNMSDAKRNIADLGIYSEDIKFSNLIPTSGTNVNINTTIINLGTNEAFMLPLQFFDNGVQMGENLTIGYIPSLSNVTVNFTWNPTPGVHTISIRVNPDRRIDEPDYSNNEASKLIKVGSTSDKMPPLSITNPSLQAAGPTWLNFTWFNPPDPDFSHVMLYLNGAFITNITAPQNYYNFTGLDPDTLYELGTHTVDSSGNVNETWVNATGRTLPSSGTANPIVSNPTASHEIPDDTDNEPLWGETAQLNVTVTDDSEIASVTVNLSEIGGLAAKPLTNIGGNIWSTTTNASAGTPPKIYNLTVKATDTFGNSNTSVTIPLRVMKNGDCNGNGALNSGDATRVYMNTSYPSNPLYPLSSPYVCDVTGNGAINSGDATRIYMNTSYPANPLYPLK